MNLKEYCTMINVPHNRAEAYVRAMLKEKAGRDISNQEMLRVCNKLSPIQRYLVAKQFPHTKKVIITCDRHGNTEAVFYGAWRGTDMLPIARMVGKDGRKLYRKHQDALKSDKDIVSFRSGPSIKEVNAMRAESKRNMEKAKELRDQLMRATDDETVEEIVREIEQVEKSDDGGETPESATSDSPTKTKDVKKQSSAYSTETEVTYNQQKELNNA